MKLNLMNLRVPVGSHEAELVDVSLFTARDGLQFLKLRFDIFCKNRNYRLEKNYPDPGNNPYFLKLIEELGIRLKKGMILETEELKEYLYDVTISEDSNGKRYIQSVVPALEEEGEDFDDEDDTRYDGKKKKNTGYDEKEAENTSYDGEEAEEAEDAEYGED